MATAAPLQILLFRHTEDEDALPYQESILRAFQGGREAGGYLATGMFASLSSARMVMISLAVEFAGRPLKGQHQCLIA